MVVFLSVSLILTVLGIVVFFQSRKVETLPVPSFGFPDFLPSLKRYGKSDKVFQSSYAENLQNPLNIRLRRAIKKYDEIYERNLCYVTSSKEMPYRIPPVVHQIWLGSEVPKEFKEWMDSWKIEGWTYKLWTDKEAATFPLHNRKLYEDAKNYGEKSDILRYEILYEEGGLYVDIDFEALRPQIFSVLHKSFDFFVGIEPLEHPKSEASPRIGNALISSVPQHPLLKTLILGLRENRLRDTTGRATYQTGPDYLTKVIMAYEKEKKSTLRNVYLPPPFFYPITDQESQKWTRERQKNESLKFKEAIAVHYWAGTWSNKKAHKHPIKEAFSKLLKLFRFTR